MRIAGYNISEVWWALLDNLIVEGRFVSPRQQGTRELLGVQLHIANARDNILVNEIRKISYRFMVAEWLWIWYGRDDVATISRYNSKITQFSDNGIDFNGAYGKRIRPRWDAVINRIKSDPDTRQAVIDVFSHEDLLRETKDVPCTISLQFLLRDGRLHTIANMRSSDVWLGLPYDVFNFTMLANVAAAQLGVDLGPITLNLGSSHLYDRDREKADEARWVQNHSYVRSPRLYEAPPAWLEDVLVTGRMRPLAEGPWLTYGSILEDTSNANNLERLKRWPK